MSDPTDNAQITEELQILQIEIFFIWSATALVTYEYLITIHNEITMVWRKKWTAATWLFILNRYLLVAYTILSIVPYTPRTCIGTAQLVNLVNLSQYIVFALFSALRAYAIHNFNIAIFLAVFSLNVIPVGTNIYTYVRTPEAYVGGICTQSASIPADISFDLTILTSLAMIAGDLAVLVVTWMKTFEQFREARAFEISTLTGILLRDGTVYFMALLAMNIAQICFSSIPSLHNSVGVPTVLFIQVLTPVLISRFLLNLRDANNRGINPQGTTLSQFSVPEFRHSFPARHIGAMGESLDHSLSAVQDEDAEEAPYNSTSSVVLGPDDENDIEGARQISHEEVV